MSEFHSLVSQIKEFLTSGSSPHSQLQACADIFRFMQRSHNPDLQDLVKKYEFEIAHFTKELVGHLMEHLGGEETSYDGSSGLLSKKQANSLELIDTLVAMASELDKTGDPELIKEASVLDEILLTLAAPRDAKMAFKLAEDQEIERLREKYRTESLDRSYKYPREELQKDLRAAEAIKAIENSIKEYRPLEAPLSTRTCPDHPGAQMQRIGDGIYQCSLDKKVYNYQGGFTTMRGAKVPGGDVSAQTQALGDRAVENMSFDTRESKLNP